MFFRRLSGQSVPHDVKRQRFHSHNSETTVVNQAVPSPEERRFSFPGSAQSPVFNARYIPDLTGSVLPLQDNLLPYPKETTLPVTKDKVISFYACALRLPWEWARSNGSGGTTKISARLFDSDVRCLSLSCH